MKRGRHERRMGCEEKVFSNPIFAIFYRSVIVSFFCGKWMGRHREESLPLEPAPSHGTYCSDSYFLSTIKFMILYYDFAVNVCTFEFPASHDRRSERTGGCDF